MVSFLYWKNEDGSLEVRHQESEGSRWISIGRIREYQDENNHFFWGVVNPDCPQYSLEYLIADKFRSKEEARNFLFYQKYQCYPEN